MITIGDNEDIHYIKNIHFGILSNEDILKMSVCEITNTKKNGENSIYDIRMGPLNNNKCITCNMDALKCRGHFGHINLFYPIIHPFYYSYVTNILRCFCWNCKLPLFKENKIKDFNKIYNILKKTIRICNLCQTENKNIKIIDGLIVRNDIKLSFEETINEIKLIPYISKYMIKVLPIIPTMCRPQLKTEDILCDDDLSIQYIEIVKNNNYIQDKTISLEKKSKYYSVLVFRIATLFNNSAQKAKHTTNAKPIKSILERLVGKEGQFRNNALGKRTELSARTVISPDPTLKLNEVKIPLEFAQTLTFQEPVNKLNFDNLNKLLHQDRKVKYVKRKNGAEIDIQRYLKNKEIFKLEIGDIVCRELQDGDWCLINRAPSLWKNSFQGMRIIIDKNDQQTMSFNLSVCNSLNADFDGDELNYWHPATYQAVAEIQEIANTEKNINCVSTGKNIIIATQDCLFASYILSKENRKIEKKYFFDIISIINNIDYMKKINTIRKINKRKGNKSQAFNGRGLISVLLPNDFFYEYNDVKIEEGVFYDGIMDKQILGSSFNSIIYIMNKNYNSKIAMDFIDNLQFITNKWLMFYGYTISLKDCMTKININEKINNIINESEKELEQIDNIISNNEHREIKINMVLNNIKDKCLKITKDVFYDDNNMIKIINSGSKGNIVNIGQIVGVIGQQNIEKGRIQLQINRKQRSTIFYEKTNKTTINKIKERGFITSNYINGLTPEESFITAIAGREAIGQTALGTSVSGYSQRRIGKLLENNTISYDGTVRNKNGKIIMFDYNDGIDPMKTNDYDIDNIIKRLNFNYENSKK